MLVRLEALQIDKYWELIREALLESLPPYVPKWDTELNAILASILSGKMQVWVICRSATGNPVRGLIVTLVETDECSGAKDLLVYALYSWRWLSREEYADAIRTLTGFGAACGCNTLCACTQNENLIGILQELGCDASYTLLSKEIPLWAAKAEAVAEAEALAR